MPELLVDYITSLDGYGAAEGWPGLWGYDCPEYLAWVAEEPSGTTATALMGAATYRLFAGMAAEHEADFAAMTAQDKVVFSSTLDEPLTWPNARLVATDPVAAVRDLKATSAAPLLTTIGSLTLARALLGAGLVDRFRVVVFPFVTGTTGHERVYDGYPDLALDLVESRTFDGALQLLEYRPRLLHGPPG